MTSWSFPTVGPSAVSYLATCIHFGLNSSIRPETSFILSLVCASLSSPLQTPFHHKLLWVVHPSQVHYHLLQCGLSRFTLKMSWMLQNACRLQPPDRSSLYSASPIFWVALKDAIKWTYNLRGLCNHKFLAVRSTELPTFKVTSRHWASV